MFDCNTFKDKRYLLILVAITLPSKELHFCNFTHFSSYYSAIQRATVLQLYYVVDQPK